MEDLDGAAHVLDLVLAAVDEGVLDAQLDQVAHRARHGDAAGLGQRLDAGGKIDAVAEDVLVFLVDDHLAEMDADAEHHALVFGQRLVEARHAFLDVDRRADGGDGRAELGQHGVARRADQPAAAGFDGRPPDLDLRRFQVPEGARFGALHHPGEPGEVGMDDGGETALHDGLV